MGQNARRCGQHGTLPAVEERTTLGEQDFNNHDRRYAAAAHRGTYQLLRGLRVMIDADLASLYGVPTKVRNQAVKRNSGRFPSDFVFQLSAAEKAEVVTNCDHLAKLKFSRWKGVAKGKRKS
jgi:ORF6N domain